MERFKTEVLARLRRWCEQHESQVTACYVPTGSTACLKVFVVAKQARFDFDLADSITDLEADLDGAGWPCDILQIASGEPGELAAFFDPHDSIQVYGDGNRGTASQES